MEILILILPEIIKALQQCREDREREAIEEGLRNPGPLERLFVRASLKKRFKLKGRELGKQTRKAVAAMRELEHDDIKAVTAVVYNDPEED